MKDLVVLLSLLAAASACAEPSSGSDSEAPAVGDPAAPAVGDPAVWSLPEESRFGPETASFMADVSRLGCNGGVTGEVLHPVVTYEADRIVVTFAVEPTTGDATCQSNKVEPYEVVLDEPIDGRPVVDGHCLAAGAAVDTSFCTPDGTRFAG